MSTPVHQSLRHRLIARVGGAWERDQSTGDDLLVAGDGTRIRVLQDDLALMRRDGLWAHLQALAARRERLALIASLAPMPDRAATLLPVDVWRDVLRAAGLPVSIALDVEGTSASRWGGTWRLADPYRLGDVAAAAFVVEPGPPDDPEAASALVRRLVGPQHRDVASGARLGFLVSSYQDFHTLQPWLARVAPTQRTLLLRDGAPGQAPGIRDDLRAALAPYGGRSITLDEQPSLAIAGAGVDVLVSSSESTANLAHLGNAGALLVARAHGIATVHAQHGVWPRAEFPPPIHSVADVVAAWSDEYREIVAPPTRVAVTGAPRFDRYADRVHRHVRGLYGEWTARYDRHVVLATNLHWRQHGTAIDTHGLVTDLATTWPDTLFTVKPHPYEAPPADGSWPPNVVVLAQGVMLAAGIEPADVVEAADLVVTTPSTFALEAALAGRPCLVLATGNPNRHDHVTEHDASTVSGWLHEPSPPPGAAAYVARYCAPATIGRAFERTLEMLQGLSLRTTTVPPGTAAIVDGLLGALARLGHEHRTVCEARARESAEVGRYVESLNWTIARKDAHIDSLHARLGITPS